VCDRFSRANATSQAFCFRGAKKVILSNGHNGFMRRRVIHNVPKTGLRHDARKIRCGNLSVLRKTRRACIASKIGNSGKKETVAMLKVKDTLRSTVHMSFDGRVVKMYHGPKAHERFTNEVQVLRHLEKHGCHFVPRLLEADEHNLRIITTNCGTRVEHIDEERAKQLFAELEKYGVRHDDPDVRNITYRFSDGRFCLIDFEFATILPKTP
jgi:hypothetical protein